MLSVQEALSIISRQVQPVAPQLLDLPQAAGFYLAAPVVLDLDSPPFDRAVLDGFALRAADTQTAAPLQIIARQDAGGSLFSGVVGPGQCVGINTGAPLPAGADAVLMVELARQVPQTSPTPAAVGGAIEPIRPVAPGEAVQKRGADARAGQTVLPAGTCLHPAQLAVAATAGAAQLSVRRPRVAILTTGDELVDIAASPGPGQIRNSNGPMLHALIQQLLGPASAIDLGACPDDASELRRRMQDGLARAELLLVCGGMSMGTRDLAPTLLAELGFTLHIQKVRIKPGKPFIFGTRDSSPDASSPGRRYVAGLPGNPVSAFVTFHRFVRAILARLCDAPPPPPPTPLSARTTIDLPANADREFYHPCTLAMSDGTLRATPLPWTGSADLFTLARAHALLLRPPNAPALPADSPIPILPLAEFP